MKKSLRTQLAYNAGFECMTNGFTNWMINKRTRLFANGSPHVVSFFLMHAVEETEHKTVAYDAYMAYSGMFTALKKDRQLGRPRSIFSIVREVGSMVGNVAPYLLRALLPSHNPRRDDDPQWVKDWIRGHAALPKGAMLPLIDTTDPEMPVPFAVGPFDGRSVSGESDRRKAERRRDVVPDVAAVLGFPDRRVGDRRITPEFAVA